jgi:hypothetical protein
MRVCVRVRRRDTAPDPRTPGGRGVSRVYMYAFPRSCACFSGSAPPAAFVVPHPPQTRTV